MSEKKRTKEQEQVDNIFKNLFSPTSQDPVSDSDQKKEKSIENRSIEDEDLDKESLHKESLPKKNLDKSSLPKINLLKRGHYTVVDNHILDYVIKKLKPNQFVVYLYLYRKTYGWNTGTNEISISTSTMQEELSMSHVTIGKHISALRSKGLIEITKKKNRNRSRTYKVLLPSQIEGYLPKELLGKEGLDKGFNEITERNFRSPTKKTLGKNCLGKGSNSLVQQDPSERKKVPKDNVKDIHKDNNKTMLLLSSSKIINIPEPTIYNLIEKSSHETIETWVRFIEDKKKDLDNPSGFFRCAIEQGWDIPSKWEENHKEKKVMEQQAQKEEKRIAQEKEKWESWLESVSDETHKNAEEYAEKKIEEFPINPKDKEIKEDMLNGFKKDFLRRMYEEEKRG